MRLMRRRDHDDIHRFEFTGIPRRVRDSLLRRDAPRLFRIGPQDGVDPMSPPSEGRAVDPPPVRSDKSDFYSRL